MLHDHVKFTSNQTSLSLISSRFSRSTPFPSSSRLSGMARSSLPHQTSSADKRGRGSMWKMAAPPVHHPHPLFLQMPSWLIHHPANSHTVDWDLDLMCSVSFLLPFLLISQSQLKLSLPCANERTAHFYLEQILQPISREQLVSQNWFFFPPCEHCSKRFASFANSRDDLYIFYLSGYCWLNLACRIANTWTGILIPLCNKSTAANQDASGCSSFLPPLPGLEGLVCVLSCDLIGFFVSFYAIQWWIQHLSNSSFTEDKGIHITSAGVYCNNINIHSGYCEQKR